MKAKYLGLCLLGASLGLSSCNDFLDLKPSDKATNSLVWSSSTNAQMAIDYYYCLLPALSSFGTYQCSVGMAEGLTDEFKYGNMTFNALMYIPNEISYGGLPLTAGYTDTYLGVWESTYENIRRINESLQYLHRSSLGENDVKYFEGQLRFFRGMCYFELLKRYHQAILYTEDLSQISTNKKLDSEEEGWKFVQADLKFAGENLPVSASATGRLTSGAAYALLSRAMLYCKDWTAVKEAAEKVIAMKYQLTDNYADAFTGGNSEAICQYTYDSKISLTHSFDTYYAPGGDKALDGNQADGGFGTPTQDMVEEYEMTDGKRFDWVAWHEAAKTGTTLAPPYDKLEPRFKATILYNGATWKGRKIEPFVGGTDGWCRWEADPKTNGRTTTGYYLRKLVDENHHFTTVQNSTQPCIVIRLAEVYLNYAEACYRLNDAAKALEYLNKVRERVALPKLTGLSGDRLFEALRHERKVELAFEGLYYWDMRRWELADQTFTGFRRHGLKIEKMGDLYRYTYVDVDNQDLNFPKKLYRLPVPVGELNNNKEIDQFPEWK
ncbi:RagB/SusD family nutrient uptake outer membrane protein [Segatella baroniae]|uniref:RagB/SusD family nutrient uptake outer membrane protein n=1 Tax=Segatella baroniae TaxID=305719 RepID=UPI0028F02519|nr:RagB/SusD family nutrient uptake outer membrane protein [Segatella baroniae]